MLEKIGSQEVVVRNYTDNFSVKEFIQEELIPRAFPDIPLNKLNLGFTGVVSEYISQAIEDAQSTAALMMNEAFPTKASLPESLYAQASMFDLGYQFAVPSKCKFALQIQISDIVDHSVSVSGSTAKRYYLDRNTAIVIGSSQYSLDYDIVIDHTMIGGKRVFNVYYDMTETNSISEVTNKHIKCQVSSSGWLVLFLELKEFTRRTETVDIVDNFITTNSDIELIWTRQAVGIDLIYITPKGDRLPMKLKPKYSSPSVDPFIYYRYDTENSMYLTFSPALGYWTPDFNSKIEYTIYACNGEASNFVSYDRISALPVKKNGDRYSYNTETAMSAFCYSGSQGGLNRGNMETLRDQIVLAYNTANVLTTERDLALWFETYGRRNNSISTIVKRRDDPTGRLFSQYIGIKDGQYVYETNTLTLRVSEDEFDYVNDEQEFIIKPGHLWEYMEDSVEKIQMIHGADGIAMVTDQNLPEISNSRPFIFTNPFLIKVSRSPMMSMNYNCMLSHTSYPEEIKINSESFHQFQLSEFTIERSVTSNVLHIEISCMPVITSEAGMRYVDGIGDEYPVDQNNLRVVMVFKTAALGETGYIEMAPVSMEENLIVYAADVPIIDNVNDDMQIEIDLTKCDVKPLQIGEHSGHVLIDSSESHFDFLCLVKDPSVRTRTELYNSSAFAGYTMTNRFTNRFRELNVYTPLSMMRNTITFSGDSGNYVIELSMSPVLKHSVALDDERMQYFIQSFDAQYKAMEPILSRLDGNSFLDFKLYRTYGRSYNYYIGPEPGVLNLKDSTISLDDLYIRIKLIISVYDRSLYTQSVEEIKQLIINRFSHLSGEDGDVYVSDIIRDITDTIPNVRYVRFVGFNDYDANMQAIFVKRKDLSNLTQEELSLIVPEMISFDEAGIEISEET